MHPILLTALEDGLTLGEPRWLWALLLLLPLGWLAVDASRRREALLSRILAPRLQPRLAGQVSLAKRRFRTACLLGAIALSLTALAKPRLGYREIETKTRGRDVILALDTSRSMLSTDTAPTRLGRAKLIAQDLLTLLKGDRVGLIAFAGNAFLQAPLTLDKGAVLTSLEDLDANTIPKGGTDIASAIRMAIAAFGKGEGTTRALVLMTDGEDLEQSGVEAAKEAAAAGIRIFTIGFGSPAGSLIPIRTEGGRNDFVRDERGRPVNSKLDEDRLTEIARETGGFYQPYGQDAAKAICDRGILPMEAQETGTYSGRKPIERYAWPATGALVLLALWSLVGEGRRGNGIGNRNGNRNGNGAVSALFLAAGLAFSSGTLRASGIGEYNQGNYAGALQDFEKRLQSGSASPEIRFDAGAAAYKAGDYKKAAGYFSEAMTSAKPKVREDATYNLANALVRSGEAAQEPEAKLSDWKNALQHYETVLKTDPRNVRAKENRDIVNKLIEDLKKQQEQQKKNDRDKKKDQKNQSDKQDKQDKKDQNKDQQQSDQSQGGGQGKKDQKDSQNQKDQQQNQGEKPDQNKDQSQKNQAGEDQKKDQQQGQPSPTPAPSPSPDQAKGGKDANQGKEEKKDTQQNKGDQGGGGKEKDSRQDQPQAGQQPSPQQQNGDQQKQEQQGQQGKQAQQGDRGGVPTPTPAPSASPKKEGTLGGGEQGKREEQQGAEAAEAEEGKDGKMSPSQARALLRSVQDEEQHILNQQRRSLDQPLRDW